MDILDHGIETTALLRGLPRVIGDSYRSVIILGSEDLLFLKFRDCLDPTRFRKGKGDLIASMHGF